MEVAEFENLPPRPVAFRFGRGMLLISSIFFLIVINISAVMARGYYLVHKDQITEVVSSNIHSSAGKSDARGALISPSESDNIHSSFLSTSLAALSAGLREVFGNIFTVGQLQISGLKHLKRKEIIESLGWKGEAPRIWEAMPTSVESKIAMLPWIKSASVNISVLPLAMRIVITESEPWIVAEYERHSWLIDDLGKLVADLSMLGRGDIVIQAASLPRLDGIDFTDGAAGFLDSANARLAHALNAIKIINEKKIVPFNVERYSLLSDGALLLYPEMESDNPELKLNVNCEAEAERTSLLLSQVRADLNRRGEKARSIDLRFDNQIIVK